MHATEIPIATPCGADWRSMKPTDNKRFCDSCRKHVHDLSAMTKEEARAVLASPPVEGLCVRYLHDVHGDIVFQQGPIAPTLLVRAKRFAMVAAAAALPMAMAACGGGATGSPPPLMGAVACPVPPIPTPSASASAIAPEVLIPAMGAPPAIAPSAAPSAAPLAPTP
jgi:hypothetical protein